MTSDWRHGLNPHLIKREGGCGTPRGPRAMGVGEEEDQARETK